MTTSEKRIRPLTELENGHTATVVKLKLEHNEERRLNELGLRRGSCVKIIQGKKNESVMIAVADCRIGVNYDTAMHILVF